MRRPTMIHARLAKLESIVARECRVCGAGTGRLVMFLPVSFDDAAPAGEPREPGRCAVCGRTEPRFPAITFREAT